MTGFDYDVLIIGSGFGGSVAALRAAEKGYRVGVMESGRAGKTKTSRRPSGTCRASCGSRARSCTGSSGSSTSTTCSSCAARASAAARTSTPARCTSRRGSSSTRRNGRASPTGPGELAPSTRRAGCSRRPLPLLPTDVDRSAPPMRWAGDVNCCCRRPRRRPAWAGDLLGVPGRTGASCGTATGSRRAERWPRTALANSALVPRAARSRPRDAFADRHAAAARGVLRRRPGPRTASWLPRYGSAAHRMGPLPCRPAGRSTEPDAPTASGSGPTTWRRR